MHTLSRTSYNSLTHVLSDRDALFGTRRRRKTCDWCRDAASPRPVSATADRAQPECGLRIAARVSRLCPVSTALCLGDALEDGEEGEIGEKGEKGEIGEGRGEEEEKKKKRKRRVCCCTSRSAMRFDRLLSVVVMDDPTGLFKLFRSRARSTGEKGECESQATAKFK